MKIANFWRSGLVIGLAGLVISGCGAGVDANELVRTAMLNSYDIDSSTVQIAANLEFMVEGEDAEGKNANAEGDFDLGVNGYFSKTEDLRPLFDLAFDLKGQFEEGDSVVGGSGKVSVKMTDDAMYLNIESLPELLLGNAGPEVADYVGKWWKFPLTDDVKKLFVSTLDAEKEAELRKIVEQTEYFDKLKVVGSDKVADLDTYHLRGTLSGDGLVNYFKAVSAMTGQDISETDLVEVERLMSVVDDVEVELWIDKETGNYVKIAAQFEGDFADLTAELQPELPKDQLPEGDFELGFEMTITGYNVEKEIEVPTDAQEFDTSGFESLLAPSLDGRDIQSVQQMSDEELQKLIEELEAGGQIDPSQLGL